MTGIGAPCVPVVVRSKAEDVRGSCMDGVPAEPASTPAASATGASDVVMAADACGRFVLMTVHTEIGGVGMRPLVDTGAGVSLIHVTTLEWLQTHSIKCVMHQRRSAQIMGVNSDELMMLGFVQLLVMLGTITRAIEFWVVPACLASVLLGTGMLHEFGVGIQFEECMLMLPDGGRVLFLITTDASTRYGVFVAEELTLDPQSITRVHMRVAEGPEAWDNECINLMVEQTELRQGLKTVHVAHTLADAWHNKDGRCWTVTDVANFSTRPIKLAAGTPLAEAE